MEQTTQSEGQQASNDHVNVYLRTYQKKALLVSIPRTLSFHEIKTIIKGRISIQDETMVLFHKGQRITDERSIVFGEKNIIHVVDETNVNKKEISIFIKLLDASRK